MRWLVLLAACSSSAPGVHLDAGIPVDADLELTCLVKGEYGDLGAITGTAGTVQTATTITITLDPGPPGKDDLFFRLVPNQGAFATGVAPGTYTIAGADASYNTCGLCTNLIADIKPTTGPSKFYFATSGSVTLTTVTPPISGSVANLHFVEIDITTGTAVPNGCIADIASATFTAN
jgi:hypothetical protein